MLRSSNRIRSVLSATKEHAPIPESPVHAEKPMNSDSLSDSEISDDLLFAPPTTPYSDYHNAIINHVTARDAMLLISEANTGIPSQHRFVLVDWLLKVSAELNFFPDTVYCSISLLDRISHNYNIEKCHWQLFSATCLWIASKIEEPATPAVSDFVFMCRDAYTEHEFLECEAAILRILRFNVAHTTPLFYLTDLRRGNESEQMQAYMDFFTQVSIFSNRYASIPPYAIAVVVLMLSCAACEERRRLPPQFPRLSTDDLLAYTMILIEAMTDVIQNGQNYLCTEIMRTQGDQCKAVLEGIPRKVTRAMISEFNKFY